MKLTGFRARKQTSLAQTLYEKAAISPDGQPLFNVGYGKTAGVVNRAALTVGFIGATSAYRLTISAM